MKNQAQKKSTHKLPESFQGDDLELLRSEERGLWILFVAVMVTMFSGYLYLIWETIGGAR